MERRTAAKESQVTGPIYQQRLLDGKCTYSVACNRPLAPNSGMCARHTRKHAESDAKSAAARRDANRARGLCAFCSRKSKTYRCAECQVRHAVRPRKSNDAGVYASSSRIAAATRKHADGRTRYHGQGQRGMPPREVQDDQDFAVIRKAMRLAEERLARLREIQASSLPKSEVRAAELAFNDCLYEVERFIGSIRERHRHDEDRSEDRLNRRIVRKSAG